MLKTSWATCFKQLEQHASNKLSNMLQASWATCFKQVEQHASNKLSNMLQTSWATCFKQVEQLASNKLSNMLQTSWATLMRGTLTMIYIRFLSSDSKNTYGPRFKSDKNLIILFFKSASVGFICYTKFWYLCFCSMNYSSCDDSA